jgi:hypothetical protein
LGWLPFLLRPAVRKEQQAKLQGRENSIQKVKLNSSGIIYLVSQQLMIDNNAVVTINPGSIIADFILPDNGGALNLTGSINSSLAVLNSVKKTGSASGGPTLVKCN